MAEEIVRILKSKTNRFYLGKKTKDSPSKEISHWSLREIQKPDISSKGFNVEIINPNAPPMAYLPPHEFEKAIAFHERSH